MDIQQYRVNPPGAWQECERYFLNGYQCAPYVEPEGWTALSHWGRGVYEIGSWPCVMVFIRENEDEGIFKVVEYQEGEYNAYRCPTLEERNTVVDAIAFYWWKILRPDLVQGIENVEQAPDALRGPCK